MEHQGTTAIRLTLGRGKWLSQVTIVLAGAVALGVFFSVADPWSFLLGAIYFACVAKCAYDFLYLDVFEIDAGPQRCRAKSLLRTYDFDPESVTGVRRSAWPMFGTRRYRVSYVDPDQGERRFTLLATVDPHEALTTPVRPS